MYEKYLIKNTTKEEREEIVRRSLSFCGESCDVCHLCDGLTGLGDAYETYKPYIDGEKELHEINQQFGTGAVH